MSEFLLNANERKLGPQSSLTDLRTGNRVPGVVYSQKNPSQPIDLDYNELTKVVSVAGTSSLINLKINGKTLKVLIRECQYNPVNSRLSHIDFLVIDDKHLITTEVPLVIIGTAPAVREKGGKLNLKMEKVAVKCLPDDLPSKIEVDVNSLVELGQAICVKDLQISDKVSILLDPNDPIADVTEPKKMQTVEPTTAPAASAEGAPAEGATPEGVAPAAAAGETKAEDAKES